MTMREEPLLENLLFEKFFTKRTGTFELHKWKKFDDESYTNMQKSITENVYYILNTRNHLTIEEFLEKKLTFLDFGVPDFISIYQSGSITELLIEECIKRAINSFEPRLAEVNVIMESEDENAFIVVNGKIRKKETSFFQIAYANLKK